MFCIIAAILGRTEVLGVCSRLMGPEMSLFNLPLEAALTVVLGSISKDGLAIGLLNMEFSTLKVSIENPVNLLTAVALAGNRRRYQLCGAGLGRVIVICIDGCKFKMIAETGLSENPAKKEVYT